jgi:hypothetical protein
VAQSNAQVAMETHADQDCMGLLKVTVERAHMRHRGHYNVTLSIGLQV